MTGDTQRLDRWLWFARFFKSRSLATRLCASNRVRVNGNTVTKAHQALRVGDVLTFPKDAHIRVIEVLALGHRRGPAPEARTLYEDLEPPPERHPDTPPPLPSGQRERGAGRPTKAQRRALDRLKGDP